MDSIISPANHYIEAGKSLEPNRVYSHAEVESLFQKRGLSRAALENHLKRLALLPWLTIVRVGGGYLFVVDWVLKELCERGLRAWEMLNAMNTRGNEPSSATIPPLRERSS